MSNSLVDYLTGPSGREFYERCIGARLPIVGFHDAEDAYQDMCVVAILDSRFNGDSPSRYLMKMFTRRVIDAERKVNGTIRRRYFKFSEISDHDDESKYVGAWIDNTFVGEEIEMKGNVEKIFKNGDLTFREKQMFRLLYIDQKRPDEASEDMGMTIGSFFVLRSRTVKKLRKNLDKRDYYAN